MDWKWKKWTDKIVAAGLDLKNEVEERESNWNEIDKWLEMKVIVDVDEKVDDWDETSWPCKDYYWILHSHRYLFWK